MEPGKTELVMMTISKMLKAKKKVCFAISRRQVVIELHQRLAKSFKHAKVVKVCGGYTDDLYGDIIVCTTHQCYRYYQYFDCLILDESDAFPYKNNVVLAGIVKTSCKGHIVYLTATIDDYLKQRIETKSIIHLKLNQRPHGHDLIVPKVKVGFMIILIYLLVDWLKKMKGKPVIVFVPTIKIGNRVKQFLKIYKKCELVSSKTNNRDEIINAFRQGEYELLIATTILERGITIENVNICIFMANHGVFDEASLVQMSGRVGRSFKYPVGDCLMLCTQKSDDVNSCVRKCELANENKMFMV